MPINRKVCAHNAKAIRPAFSPWIRNQPNEMQPIYLHNKATVLTAYIPGRKSTKNTHERLSSSAAPQTLLSYCAVLFVPHRDLPRSTLVYSSVTCRYSVIVITANFAGKPQESNAPVVASWLEQADAHQVPRLAHHSPSRRLLSCLRGRNRNLIQRIQRI